MNCLKYVKFVKTTESMATINVFEQYFEAEACFGGVERKAAAVLLISDSDAGRIRYEVAVNFFPHKSPDDFAISYDAYFSSVVFEAAGRRSKKREEKILELLQDEADAIASKNGGIIFWDRPLIEVRRG